MSRIEDEDHTGDRQAASRPPSVRRIDDDHHRRPNWRPAACTDQARRPIPMGTLLQVNAVSDGHLIGRSGAIRALGDQIDRAARSDDAVLITGEPGVGKALVARLLHHRSARAAAPLVTLNCAGLPEILFQSELFGHLCGSFNGAYRDKPGLFEMASNGTLFLDEVGEISARMQGVFVRFLESGNIQRVGADQPHTRVNVRLITATSRDLTAEVAHGTFREDLLERLNAIRLTIPPLRERGMDVPLLVKYFLRTYGRMHGATHLKISKETMRTLTGRRWPGNVGELEYVVERLVLKETLRFRGLRSPEAKRQEAV
jgi:anaerobic nitric oxide reductase transcription regulator